MAVREAGKHDTYVQFSIATARLAGTRLLYATLDRADWDLVAPYTWHVVADIGGMCYAQTSRREDGKRRGAISMGRLLLGEGDLGNLGRVDHLNGNGMDCRRSNIRLATQSTVLAKRRPPAGSSSVYKGVTWDGDTGKWQATFRGKKLGRFREEKDAARAFDEAAQAQWGTQAYLNFPPRPVGVAMTGAKARLVRFAIGQALDTQDVHEDPDARAALRAALQAVQPWVNEPPNWITSTRGT